MRLCGLHIGRQLLGCQTEADTILLLFHQAEVQQCIPLTVAAMGGYHVLSLLQCGFHLLIQFYTGMFLACIARINNLHTIYIYFYVVVVCVVQIEALFVHFLIKLHRASHPDVLCSPLCPGGVLVLSRAKCGRTLLPQPVVEGWLLPSFCRLAEGVFPFPLLCFRVGDEGGELRFFLSQETIRLTVYCQNSQQREAFSCPVTDRSVIQMVLHRPGTGVRVDGDERIGGCPQ